MARSVEAISLRNGSLGAVHSARSVIASLSPTRVTAQPSARAEASKRMPPGGQVIAEGIQHHNMPLPEARGVQRPRTAAGGQRGPAGDPGGIDPLRLFRPIA